MKFYFCDQLFKFDNFAHFDILNYTQNSFLEIDLFKKFRLRKDLPKALKAYDEVVVFVYNLFPCPVNIKSTSYSTSHIANVCAILSVA